MTVFAVLAVVASLATPASAVEGDLAVGDDDREVKSVESASSPDLTATGGAELSLPAVPNFAPLVQSAQTSEIPPIVFQDGFEKLSLWGGRSPSSRNKVALTPNGFEGAGLHVRIPRGSHFGADFRLDLDKTLGEDPETLFFRYFLRFDPDWDSASAGKLPGFAGVYGSTGLGGYPSRPTSPGWSARMQFFPTRDTDPRTTVGYYVYHLGQEERYGDSMRWSEPGRLVPGDWYCLEGKVQLNSLGQANGNLRAWVDGNPAFNEAGLEFRRPNEPNIRIESFWFNVYYGGKTLPSRELGLTVDNVVVSNERVGCGAGEGTSRPIQANLDGDGFDDQLTWSTCRGGPCLAVATTTKSKGQTNNRVDDAAWFSLQTHRFGMASGDLDGDGRDELVYRGRCEDSARCWRVHDVTGSTLGSGEDWGGSARFATSAAAVVLGDWDGDGREDLVYQGICKGVDTDCWRVHRSRGDSFAAPKDWGSAPTESLLPIAADITGDGLDDLVYTAACGKGTCWYTQSSQGSAFGEATMLGQARAHEFEEYEFVDFNGDGLRDLVFVRRHEKVSRIVVRLMGDDGLAAPVLVGVLDGTESEVKFRRVNVHRRTEAIVESDCGKRAPCVEHLATSWLMKLEPLRDYGSVRVRLGETRAE